MYYFHQYFIRVKVKPCGFTFLSFSSPTMNTTLIIVTPLVSQPSWLSANVLC